MGLFAKRRTNKRMEPRHFSTRLAFEDVERHFRETADDTPPLRGLLSKGRRPFFNTIVEDGHAKPVVSYGAPSVGKKSGKMGVWPAEWRVALNRTGQGFATCIYSARTWDGEIGDFAAYEKFHGSFVKSLEADDPSVQELEI